MYGHLVTCAVGAGAFSPELTCQCGHAQLSPSIPDGHSDPGQGLGRSCPSLALDAHALWRCQQPPGASGLASAVLTWPLTVSALTVQSWLLDIVKVLLTFVHRCIDPCRNLVRQS